MMLAPSGNRKRSNRARLCVEQLEPRNPLSGGILSPVDGDDPMGLDLLRKIERENALWAQQAVQSGASVLGQGASHVSVAGDGSPSAPANSTNPPNGGSRPPLIGQPGQDSQTQLLAQILNNNSSLILGSGRSLNLSAGPLARQSPLS